VLAGAFKVIQKLLGHSSLAATSIYTEADDQDLRDAVGHLSYDD
jgi:site-specific recombinase XerD